jgi:2-hydroxycyclohexanecarboxyl-CoA dehydrogenase
MKPAPRRPPHELGPVEILVNCAGWDVLMPFLDTDEAFWDKVIDINYKGASSRPATTGKRSSGPWLGRCR